jgi:hypothetical protein
MVQVAEQNGLAALNRSPLAMGFLTGKFGPDTVFGAEAVRGALDAPRRLSEGAVTVGAIDQLSFSRPVHILRIRGAVHRIHPQVKSLILYGNLTNLPRNHRFSTGVTFCPQPYFFGA